MTHCEVNRETGLTKKKKPLAEADLPLFPAIHINNTHLSAADDSFLWESSDPDAEGSDLVVWSCDYGHLVEVPTRKAEKDITGTHSSLADIFKVARKAGAALIMISPKGYRCGTLNVYAG